MAQAGQIADSLLKAYLALAIGAVVVVAVIASAVLIARRWRGGWRWVAVAVCTLGGAALLGGSVLALARVSLAAITVIGSCWIVLVAACFPSAPPDRASAK